MYGNNKAYDSTTTSSSSKPLRRIQRRNQILAATSPRSRRTDAPTTAERRTDRDDNNGAIVAITGLIREPKTATRRIPPPGVSSTRSKDSPNSKNKNSSTNGSGVDDDNNNNSSPTNASALLCAVGGASALVGGDKKQKKVIYNNFCNDPQKGMLVISDTDGGIPNPTTDRHVIIKIVASTVSYSDCMLRRGYNMNSVTEPVHLPATPGSDVVGNIIKVGIKVKNFKIGDRVASLVRTGGNARYISVPSWTLVEVPRVCDSAEAACMVSTFMTAYQSIRMVTKDQFTLNDKSILITGGIEPVGQALIQLCLRAGASNIYATGPKNRHRYIKSVLGAIPLPVEPNDWLPAVKGSMDVVFDLLCHDGIDSPYASLSSNGILVCVGMSALLGKGRQQQQQPSLTSSSGPGVLGAPISAYWTQFKGQLYSNIQSYEVWERFKTNREEFKLDLEILFHLLKKRFIKPHIAKRVALSDVPNAHASLEQENVRGQIVCLPWKRSTMGK